VKSLTFRGYLNYHLTIGSLFVWGNEIGCVRYYDGGVGFIKGGSYDEI
ncbi:hypothetical protein HMPREF9430_01038, partial [Solobacterium moorei F0204]